MVRLSRTRRRDPVHNAENDAGASRAAGSREWPQVGPGTDDVRLELPLAAILPQVPTWAERRKILARDPMASVEGFRVIVDATMRHLFGVRTCPNCPRCNHSERMS
eukprot:9092341-Pyramimonas_sp.AAC.1